MNNDGLSYPTNGMSLCEKHLKGQFETMFNEFYISVNDTNVLEKRPV